MNIYLDADRNKESKHKTRGKKTLLKTRNKLTSLLIVGIFF